MSSAAPTTPIARSTSHHGHRQATDGTPRPHRSQSTRVPASSSHNSPRTHTSQRPGGSGGGAALANVAQRDYEQSNVAQLPPTSAGRSASRERERGQYPVRTDSMRANQHSNATPSSRGTHDRYASLDAASVQQTPLNGVAVDGTQRYPAPAAGRRRTTLDTQTGRWGLGKTIGAGSMGKVKLAKNLETGEQVAIKIVPRQSTDEHRSQADRERADHSKEIRTAREAAIVSLVNHPYICGMRDVVRTANHWYMLFEYVNGGQMLDYIISHGRLKDKQARKFARQIASALDYCHRNSIVHRDLKIENILISKTGDIKIIDFGLSNLFAPQSHLKTFCGSLYFAAPELLQAKAYTGPEVDVWSFGIVLYVLVCGKVPFDDQSMPQLHAKIKKGYVEYPPWLSAECKNLISRMLVTDPKQRASLAEIMNHPWMTKGFSGPPENHLPPREPLQMPLDQDVILKMMGFDFGSPDYIQTQLAKIVSSDDYQKAIKNAHRKHSSQAADTERKRGVFDFYKRRNSMSRDTLTTSSSEAVHFGEDPVNAFSPLISIYYLVREKMERERQQTDPGALSIPVAAGEKPLRLPDLPPPPAAYTNSNTYEMAGEAPSGGRSRPRARTHGEDEVVEGIERMKLQQNDGPGAAPPIITTPTSETPMRKESTAAGLLRRFSTRRRKEPADHQAPAPAPTVNVQSPTEATATPPRKSFGVRRTRTNEGKDGLPSSASLHVTGNPKHQPELLTPPSAGENSFPKRFMSLRRSTSVDRRRLGKRGASEGPTNAEPPPTSGSDNSSYHAQQPSQAEVSEEPKARPAMAAARAKSLGHARRESIQARRLKRAQQKEEPMNVPEETDAEVAEAKAEPEPEVADEPIKPVFLKGLFSVSTTSSKPLPVIQADIIRVLRQRGVEYEEIKGGFLCTHYPSIEVGRHNMNDENLPPTGQSSTGHRRKISFNALKGNSTEKDREQFRSQQSPRTPHHRSGSSEEAVDTSEDEQNNRGKLHRRAYGKARNPGDTATHVRDDVGESMVLKFEIFIVKVPILTLHGIQFKKVDGNMMHYKNMAQEILRALKL